jgi:3-hydroxybutyrate dehydrogenase
LPFASSEADFVRAMERNLTGKTALITGSTSGLGKAIAEALAGAGCNVMLNGFGKPAEIEALQQELASAHKIKTGYHGADLSQPAEIRELMARTTEQFGTVDILVNNAGFQFVAPLEDFPEEKWNGMLAVNLSAAFHTTKAALPAMRAHKWGRIINIASAHGLVGSPFKSAYVATKHGLVGLSKVTALETARDGITCNALCPGFIHTAVVERQIDEQARVTGIAREKIVEEVILAKHPTREFVHAEQVAAFVLFLCSDDGASTTGAALSIDGGWAAI